METFMKTCKICNVFAQQTTALCVLIHWPALNAV